MRSCQRLTEIVDSRADWECDNGTDESNPMNSLPPLDDNSSLSCSKVSASSLSGLGVIPVEGHESFDPEDSGSCPAST